MKIYSVRNVDQRARYPSQVLGLTATPVSSSQINLTWNAVSGAVYYTVRRYAQIVGNLLAVTSFSDTGLPASTQESYTVSAVNASGEGLPSAPVFAMTQGTVIQGGGGVIKFNNGHYLELDQGAGYTAWIAALNGLDSHFAGAAMTLKWSQLEFAEGVYTSGSGTTASGFALIDQFLTILSGMNKNFILEWTDRTFGAAFVYTTGPGPLPGLPPYFATLNSGSPGYSDAPTGTTWSGSLQGIANVWTSYVTARAIALVQAYGARYDPNPNFEMWRTPETAVGGPPPGFTSALYVQQIQAWMPAARAAFPNTAISISTNYLQNDPAAMEGLIASAVPYAIGVGGPDNRFPPASDANIIFTGTTGGVDYRNVIPWVSEYQQESGGQTAQAIYNFDQTGALSSGGSTQANYYLWQPGTAFTQAQLIAAIPSMPVNTTRPSSYGASSTLPGQVTGLTATAVSTSQINLSWATDTGATSYLIYRGATLINTVTVTTYSDTGLSAGTAYSYTVKGNNATGYGPISAAANATTQSLAAPVQVTGLTATAVSTSQINLAWSAATGAATYTVRRGVVIVASGVSVTSYSDTGLAAGTVYSYTVAGDNSSGEGTPSATASATTLSPPIWSALPALNFTQGTASSFNLNTYCSGATSFALQSGTLETGVTLATTGVLSYNGTSPVASSGTLTFKAINSAGSAISGSTTSAISAGAITKWTIIQNFDNLADGAPCGWGSSASTVSSAMAYSGTKSCRLSVNQGDTAFGTWGGIITHPSNVARGGELWLRVRTFMPAGFNYNSIGEGDHLKFFRFHTMSNSNSNFGYDDWYINPKGTNPPFQFIYEGEQVWDGIGSPQNAIVLGTWETYEYYVRLDTVPVVKGGQARVRTWKNGVLMAELNDRITLETTDGYSDRTHIFTYWNGGSPATQSMYIDDVELTTDTPAARDANGNPFIGVGNF